MNFATYTVLVLLGMGNLFFMAYVCSLLEKLRKDLEGRR
jgi:hypothetical protein